MPMLLFSLAMMLKLKGHSFESFASSALPRCVIFKISFVRTLTWLDTMRESIC
jgi:hypothetical protein